ncbi:MAG: LD-carboxypeptidase [Rhodospirillales bacterium]|nr:LD-carboxypeptidase [Rhodospirillales bacterium]
MPAAFPLRPGDTIGVCSPSSFVLPDDLAAGISALESRGFRVRIHPQTYARWNQSAGTHAEKISALHDLFTDPDIRAVWAAGGGNRALHLLDRIDWDLIRNHPKPFIGFSDSTALLNTMTARAGLTTIHGPVLKRVRKGAELDHLLKLLSGESVCLPVDEVEIFRPGIAQAPLFGGNLALIQCLVGTHDMPDCSGAILFLEDVGEEISRIDRGFAQIARAGIFRKIAGLVLGHFADMKDSGRPFGLTLRDIVAEHLDGCDIPIILNAPFGHSGPLYALPVGGEGQIEARTDGSARLTCRIAE